MSTYFRLHSTWGKSSPPDHTNAAESSSNPHSDWFDAVHGNKMSPNRKTKKNKNTHRQIPQWQLSKTIHSRWLTLFDEWHLEFFTAAVCVTSKTYIDKSWEGEWVFVTLKQKLLLKALKELCQVLLWKCFKSLQRNAVLQSLLLFSYKKIKDRDTKKSWSRKEGNKTVPASTEPTLSLSYNSPHAPCAKHSPFPTLFVSCSPGLSAAFYQIVAF